MTDNNKTKRLEIIYDPVEFDKLQIHEAKTYVRNYLDNTQRAVTETKAEIILKYAEKYKKEKYPLLEIKEKVVEDLENRVSERYISQCLTDEFKRPSAVARKAGKGVKQKQGITNTGASGSSTMLEEPEHTTGDNHGDDDSVSGSDIVEDGNNREPLPDVKPSLESETEVSMEYIDSLKNQINALNGTIPFADMLAHYRVVNIDQTKIGELETAAKSSPKKSAWMTIDTRTQEVKEVHSEKEFKKKFKS